ncbi:MAG: hypothetical protein AB7V77_00855 [Candidatus Woesearchaeota archaeon]
MNNQPTLFDTTNMPENNYSSVDDTLIKYAFTNKDTLRKAAIILNQGGLQDVKKWMTIDDVMALAVGLYNIKQDSTSEQREIIAKTCDVYDIVNLAYKYDKAPNPFSEIRTKRPNGLKPTQLEKKLKSKKGLNEKQDAFYEAQMQGEYDKIGLETRMDNLTSEEIKTFKKTFIDTPKKYVSPKFYEQNSRRYAEDFTDRFIVCDMTKKYFSEIIAGNLKN